MRHRGWRGGEWRPPSLLGGGQGRKARPRNNNKAMGATPTRGTTRSCSCSCSSSPSIHGHKCLDVARCLGGPPSTAPTPMSARSRRDRPHRASPQQKGQPAARRPVCGAVGLILVVDGMGRPRPAGGMCLTPTLLRTSSPWRTTTPNDRKRRQARPPRTPSCARPSPTATTPALPVGLWTVRGEACFFNTARSQWE